MRIPTLSTPKSPATEPAANGKTSPRTPSMLSAPVAFILPKVSKSNETISGGKWQDPTFKLCRDKGAADMSYKAILGKGSFGCVKLAVVTQTHARCAVKQMHKGLFVKQSHLTQVLHERQLMEEFDHPFIVHLYSSFQDKTHLYFVMEFVQGGELYSHVKKRRLDLDEARFYVGLVVLVFDYLHKMDVAYRDLKPENLMLCADGYLKLIDFSFAKRLPNGTRTYTLCGTPEYIAPEVLQSTGHSLGADWWTVGIFAYELEVGEPPFENSTQNVLDLYKKILTGILLFPRDLAPATRHLVKRLCDRDLTKRLGCTKSRARGVKQHRYFRGFDFKAHLAKTVRPPHVPKFCGLYDLRCFHGACLDDKGDSDDDDDRKGNKDWAAATRTKPFKSDKTPQTVRVARRQKHCYKL